MNDIRQFCCTKMALYASEELAVVRYDRRFDEYGINLPEDQSSRILLQFCPWCGEKLPDSQRDKWFDQLELLGFDNPYMRDDIPIPFTCEDWRINK